MPYRTITQHRAKATKVHEMSQCLPFVARHLHQLLNLWPPITKCIVLLIIQLQNHKPFFLID
ncbi:hypothetical protein NC651_001475 [Populus alba x Populus x berolinensis]|nr:hypothetical protein NC651_001475 [Populus alba x Populus x berolinensis]